LPWPTQVRIPGFANWGDKKLWIEMVGLRGLAPGPNTNYIGIKQHGQNFIFK
jgi:hypothetical protein